MRFQIKHERDGRIRIHLTDIKKMSCRQADILQYYLENTAGADKAKCDYIRQIMDIGSLNRTAYSKYYYGRMSI